MRLDLSTSKARPWRILEATLARYTRNSPPPDIKSPALSSDASDAHSTTVIKEDLEFDPSEAMSHYDQPIADIAEYVFHYDIDVADETVWERARMALLDSLGCAVETVVTSAECGKLLGPVVPGTVVPNGFRIPGTHIQLDPVEGTFALGALVRYLDHNDALGGCRMGTSIR